MATRRAITKPPGRTIGDHIEYYYLDTESRFKCPIESGSGHALDYIKPACAYPAAPGAGCRVGAVLVNRAGCGQLQGVHGVSNRSNVFSIPLRLARLACGQNFPVDSLYSTW